MDKVQNIKFYRMSLYDVELPFAFSGTKGLKHVQKARSMKTIFCQSSVFDCVFYVTGIRGNWNSAESPNPLFWLSRAKLKIIFCYCCPSASRFDMLCIMRCFSAQHGCKEWLFGFTLAVSSNHTLLFSLIRKVFPATELQFFWVYISTL